jgi:hypothetical protein
LCGRAYLVFLDTGEKDPNHLPKYNPRLQKAIFDVIDNQIKGNDPPETRETFNRLVREGHSKTETRKLIGCAIAVELYDIIKHQKPFDRERFVGNLTRLPELPFDDEEE